MVAELFEETASGRHPGLSFGQLCDFRELVIFDPEGDHAWPKRSPAVHFEGGLDDLESFQAWDEEIKTYLSQPNPALHEVLGQTAASKQPIDEEGLVKASQDVLKEKH